MNNTRGEVIEALAKGARYCKTYEGDDNGYWMDIFFSLSDQQAGLYRAGPRADPAAVMDEVESIFREAGIRPEA